MTDLSIRHIFFIIIIYFLLPLDNLVSNERKLIKLADNYINNGEYYNAITEIMRYQYLYPEGKDFPHSLLMLGDAYKRGGNYYKSIKSYQNCYDRYKDIREGERALVELGNLRLVKGSSYFAFRSFQEYLYIYKNGLYTEEVDADICFAKALMNDVGGASESINGYKRKYPDGRYQKKVNDLQELIDTTINKPRKSLWVSVMGSIFMPGFGHFYTGKYSLGFLSFFTNAALIYLFYDAVRDDDKFRMIFFGVGEFSFYQYSLYSAISNVYDYNSRDKFYKNVRLYLSKRY